MAMAELTQMIILSLGELEAQLGVQKLPRFINQFEQQFLSRIDAIAAAVTADPNIKAVFVSGPTASGKTTFSMRLRERLDCSGKRSHLISLDDYYKTRDVRHDLQGRPDFESLDTLDIDLMVNQIGSLLNGRRVPLPVFDFVGRTRSFPEQRRLQLQDEDILVVEGLHGLSEHVSGQLDRHQYQGVFIMPWCTLLDGRQLLGSRDLRMMRRISRDVIHRGSTALSTIDYWPMIDQTEQVFFPPYLARADHYVNSCLPYEFGVVAPLAARQIRQSLGQYEKGDLPRSIYVRNQSGYAQLNRAVDNARSLLAASERLPMIDRSLVPDYSILREFI